MKTAVLLRDVPLVVRDVSSGGCLIEFSTPLEVGMIGRLEVEFEGERRFEWFRIARIDPRGERAFLAGIEFLPLAAAGADSLRSAIGRFRGAARADGSLNAAGRFPLGSAAAEFGSTAAESSPENTDRDGKVLDFFRRRS